MHADEVTLNMTLGMHIFYLELFQSLALFKSDLNKSNNQNHNKTNLLEHSTSILLYTSAEIEIQKSIHISPKESQLFLLVPRNVLIEIKTV